MDYGVAVSHGGMGVAATAALQAVHRQLARIANGADRGLARWSALGVTTMIGVNDSPGETLALADARTVARFAAANGLGLVSIWSLARNGPCAGSSTVASSTCSGVPESTYAFSRVFGARPKPGVPPRRVVDSG
jgi:chitinase